MSTHKHGNGGGPSHDGHGHDERTGAHAHEGGDHRHPEGREVRDHGVSHDHGAHDHQDHHAHMVEDFRRRFWGCLVLTIPILLLSPAIQSFLGIEGIVSFPGQQWVLLVLASVVYFWGGRPFLKGMFDELGERRPGMMTLIAVAITVSYVYSAAVVLGLEGKVFFWELATLIDIMLLGHWIEMKSVLGASKALEELVKLLPSTAHRLEEDGTVRDVPLEDLRGGERILVRPGEKFPTDGTVLDGATTANESLLTGESLPVKKAAGDPVIGGAINGDGSVTMRVDRVGDDTFLAQVVAMVRKAQSSKSATQDLANRVALYLTIVALSVGALTFLVWWLLRRELPFAIERMVTVMVTTCPHALGLAVPLVVAVSTAIAARRGLLVRNRVAFEQARLVDTVVFDKTGTLTEGKFGVRSVIAFRDDTSEEEILRRAAALEVLSEHPIAAGIVRAAKERSVPVEPAKDFEVMKGRGVRGTVGDRSVAVVSPGYLAERSIDWDETRLAGADTEGCTVVFVVEDDRLVGAVALGDTVRPESADAVRTLHEMDIRCYMLTGDKEEVAAAVSKTLGLDGYFAQVLPDQKAVKIRELMDGGARVAMTGDGINDAPALATADVGIAVGAGTDVAVETADVILVRSDPRDIAGVFVLARRTYRKMVQNLLWAVGYNVVAIPLAAGVLASRGVLLTPAAGAVLMSLSTVIVAINARLLRA